MQRVGWVALFLVLACGGDSAPPAPIVDSGPPPDAVFVRRDAGPLPVDAFVAPEDAVVPVDASALDATADAEPPAMCEEPDGPVVEITAPAEATDPNADEVLLDDRVSVTCRVTRGATAAARPVDPSSVSIVRVDADGEPVASPVVSADGSDYSATFDVSELPNGSLIFRCLAQDTEDPPRCDLEERETLLDLGPDVGVLMPLTGSVHASRMNLRYRITTAALSVDDTEADVAGHTLVVAGVSITNIMDAGDGEFETEIDFTDRDVFPEELLGEYELQIRALNERTPTAAVRTLTQPFTIDTEGPLIVIESPDEGDLVGGRTRVLATISDPSGVDATTPVARVGMMEGIPMRRVMDDEFEVFFDASMFGRTITELTLNVTATDIVGNRATVSRVVKLDSSPPIASLDPVQVREADDIDPMFGAECSAIFDPVGSDSVDDGEVVGTAAEFRARVEDVGNTSFGGDGAVTFLAGTASVELLLLDDTNIALLVDTDEDGICDSINPAIEPDPEDPESAVLVDMTGISPAGAASLPATLDFPVGTPASAYGDVYDICAFSGGRPDPPLRCEVSSPLTRVIPTSYSIGGRRAAAIYGKPPIERASTCVGDAFDFQGSLDEGWACAAIRATDGLDNRNVSPPLRVCFIDGEGVDPCPGGLGTIAAEGMRPSCTDGCTPPPSFADNPFYQLILP